MKRKYRLTPFHLVIIGLLAFGIYLLVVIFKSEADPGNTVLLPVIIFVMAVGVLVVDFILQWIFRNNLIRLYLVQALLMVMGIYLVMRSTGTQTFVVAEKRPQYIRVIYDVRGQRKLPEKFFRLGYEIETPPSGTILTSSMEGEDFVNIDFRWKDGEKAETNWAIVPLTPSGHYHCSPGNVHYRLVYLSDTKTWQRDSTWVDQYEVDAVTAEVLKDECKRRK